MLHAFCAVFYSPPAPLTHINQAKDVNEYYHAVITITIPVTTEGEWRRKSNNLMEMWRGYFFPWLLYNTVK
jgi:hypothetical protein